MITCMPYDRASPETWDALVDASPHGALLHTRRFLDYHGDRFADASLVLLDDRERPVGVFPAALDPGDPTCVVSHPGSTYGGLVPASAGHAPEDVRAMLRAVAGHYARQGIATLRYKTVPAHLVRTPNQADVHALWLEGAVLDRRDLWNAFPTCAPRKLTKGHKWSLGRARKADLAVAEIDDDDGYAAFHALLSSNLQRHDAAPVHSLSDLRTLRARLGARVQLHGVFDDRSELLAASWVLDYGTQAWHLQYIASNPAGRDVGATVFLLQTLIERAAEDGVAWFSFGASTEAAGRTLNPGLFKHKASFGHGAIVHDHYRWDLAR